MQAQSLVLLFFCSIIANQCVKSSSITDREGETVSRIKLTKKGHYPDLVPETIKGSESSVAEEVVAPPKRKEQGKYKAQPQQNKKEIPSYFETKKPESLEGWLQKPKKKQQTTVSTTDPDKENEVKDGHCGNTLSYGIQCGLRVDQCRKDKECPGVTKCCLVSDCGFLCVKPNGKPKRQAVEKKNPKEAAVKKEVVTTAEGLKLEDITNVTEGSVANVE